MKLFSRSEEEVKAINALKEFDRQAMLEDDEQMSSEIRRILGTTGGRRVALWLLDLCGLDRYADKNESDKETFMRLGQRNVGLRIRQTVDAISPDILPLAAKERREFEAERERRRKELEESFNQSRERK